MHTRDSKVNILKTLNFIKRKVQHKSRKTLLTKAKNYTTTKKPTLKIQRLKLWNMPQPTRRREFLFKERDSRLKPVSLVHPII